MEVNNGVNIYFLPIWNTPLVRSKRYEFTGGDYSKTVEDRLDLQHYGSLFTDYVLKWLRFASYFPFKGKLFEDQVFLSPSLVPPESFFNIEISYGAIFIGSEDNMNDSLAKELEEKFPE